MKVQSDRAQCLFAGALAALVLGVIPSSVAAPLQLPPITEPASQEHHVGKVVLLELVTPDLAASKKFYGALFGWTFRDVQTGGPAYAEAFLDDRPVAGLVERPVPRGAHRPPAWLSFFAVDDVDATERLAQQHLGKVLFPPHSFPNRGREAVFADPQGAVFAVVASSSGDPPDYLAAPGEWIWSSLMTSAPDSDAGFYQALFRYDVFALPASPGAQHLLFASKTYARASANSLPTNNPNEHPYWLNYVRVEDAEKAAEKAVTLGGHVVVEPRVDRQGGKVAVVTDPLGAAFGLLEWPEGKTKEVPR